MTRDDFFSREDYTKIKNGIDNREYFEVEGIAKRENQRLNFHSGFVDNSYHDIWKGNYLVYIQESHKNGGGGYATEDFKDFETFESFMKLVDSLLKGRPEYTTPEFSEQLTFLE
ncbi:MAG: hypothetical protein M0P47_12635 [Bacteroidales bacterium]|nr:hypothetical protein [Bacteroidales bacterium]